MEVLIKNLEINKTIRTLCQWVPRHFEIYIGYDQSVVRKMNISLEKQNLAVITNSQEITFFVNPCVLSIDLSTYSRYTKN